MIEPKYTPAPQFPIKRGLDLSGSVTEYWKNGTGVYDRMDGAVQLAIGLEYDQKVNDTKFDFIRVASISIVIGIIASAIAGVLS